jgi:hypothetical protein
VKVLLERGEGVEPILYISIFYLELLEFLTMYLSNPMHLFNLTHLLTLRPGCRLHAVSSSDVVVAHSSERTALLIWLRTSSDP